MVDCGSIDKRNIRSIISKNSIIIGYENTLGNIIIRSDFITWNYIASHSHPWIHTY